MENTGTILLILGAILFLGFATDELGRRTRLPRVTLLLVFGMLIGPSAADILPEISYQWLPLITEVALLMVGFLLGEKLSTAKLNTNGRYVLGVSVGESLGTAIVVSVGLFLVGLPLGISVVLGAIAAASAPAATLDVIDQLLIRNKFVDTLEGVVAVDDAWGLLLFSFALVIVGLTVGNGEQNHILLSGLWEMGGSLILGVLIGAPMAYLTGRIRSGSPTLIEALALVFICGGLAELLEVSFLLAAIVMGMTVANLAKHHDRPFHAIEGIERPFLILFFILAGASFNLASLWDIGLIGLVYILCRLIGMFVGCYLGGSAVHAPDNIKRWMGLALTPQAGVAMGMALIAAERFPEYNELILSIVIGTTVVFELLGPLASRWAIVRASRE
jgi:Kef-type K+ transport system membrane component KefB